MRYPFDVSPSPPTSQGVAGGLVTGDGSWILYGANKHRALRLPRGEQPSAPPKKTEKKMTEKKKTEKKRTEKKKTEKKTEKKKTEKKKSHQM
ncbi:hypothetical protein V3C99_017789 [Haemonchus contortus]|uniref:Uncharacterized protein n=1 Tax=Haemonchus contortus TaxID=6289 RepID=W6NGP1_HAECO